MMWPACISTGTLSNGAGMVTLCTAADVPLVGEIVVVRESGGEVNVYALGAFFDDGFDEKTGVTEVELVFEREANFVGGMSVVVRAKDGIAVGGGCVESCVEGREKLVAQTECLGDDFRVGIACLIGFASAGVYVCIAHGRRGRRLAAWYHRVRSSFDGLPKNPPTSAPAKG